MISSLKSSLFALVVALTLQSVSSLHITFLAAPLVMLFYTGSERLVLWTALLAGLFVDAVVLSPRFGLLGISYLLTSGMLYPLRLYFFKDSLFTLPAMCALFSVVSQIAELVLVLFFDLPVPRGYVEGLILQPLVDIVYVAAVFMLPTFLWHQYAISRRKRRYSDDT